MPLLAGKRQSASRYVRPPKHPYTLTHTIQKCLTTGRQPLSKVSHSHGGVPAPRRRTGSHVVKELPAKISQAAMDTLYRQLLQLDQAAGR